MLDHEHRVPLVAQPPEHPDELVNVARVQPDGGLIEHIHEPHQIAIKLPRHLDPLALAARQGRNRPVQRQVPDADADQMRQNAAHLPDERLRHRAGHSRKPHIQVCQLHLDGLPDPFPLQPNSEPLRVEPQATAGIAVTIDQGTAGTRPAGLPAVRPPLCSRKAARAAARSLPTSWRKSRRHASW